MSNTEAAIREELWFGDDDPRAVEETAAKSLSAAVVRASGMKPFPAVAQNVLRILDERDVDLGQVTDAMEKDPILASQLMRVASSPLFRTRIPFVSLEQAIVRMGTTAVRDLVAGIAVMQLFSDVDGYGSEVRDHCAGAAAIARVLGTERRFRGVGRVFLATLMHDLGKLMFIDSGEMDYDVLPESARGSHDQCHVHERVTLGFDHAALAAGVMRAWELDEPLVELVAVHHQPAHAYTLDAEMTQASAYLRFADAIEYEVRRHRDDVPPEVLESLCAHDANAYADFHPAGLGALWPRFVEGVDELLSIFVV